MTRLAHQSATYATLMMMMIGQCLCDNRNGIKPCKSKKKFFELYTGDGMQFYTHVQCFSALADSTTAEYEISNRGFMHFIHKYYCGPVC